MSAKSWWKKRFTLSSSSLLFLLVVLPLTQSFNPIELSIQICAGQSPLNQEQRETVLKSFLNNVPVILSKNSGLDIIPRISSSSQDCVADGRHYLKKNNRSQLNFDQDNEVDTLKTSSFHEESLTTFISYKNGQLFLTSENSTYSLQQFCISAKIKDAKPEKNKTTINFRIFQCLSESYEASTCSIKRPCVRKCCRENEAWDIMNSTCRKLPESSSENSRHWDPNFYTLSPDGDCVIKLDNIEEDNHSNDSLVAEFHYKIGPPENCAATEDWNAIPSRNIIGEFALGRFRMLLNGSVLMNYDNGTWIALSHESYCVDEIHTSSLMLKYKEGKNASVQKSSNKRGTKVLLVCKDEYKLKGPKRPIPYQYATMLYSAAVILFLTVMVYLLLWDRHSIYEWTIFFEVLSMFFMIVFVAVSHTVARDATEGYYGSRRCIALGMASHFFFLATFFWLFIINFEIWWNFRTLTIRNRKSRKWLRLGIYHLLGFGGPAIIVLIGWLLDKRYGLQNDDIDCTSLIIPNYGQLNCYISKRAQGPYIYYPVGVLLGFNLLFYFMTVFKMCQYQKNSQQISRSKTNGQFQSVAVFARLFILHGVCWTAEIVVWILKPRIRGSVPLYWIVFDVVTLVQAIAIFFIFVFRREILDNLIGKYPSLQKILNPLYRLPCFRKPKQKNNKTNGNGVNNGINKPNTDSPNRRRGTLASSESDNSTAIGVIDISKSSAPKSICEQINLDDLNPKDLPQAKLAES